MRKSMMHRVMAFGFVLFLLLQSCKDDSYLTQAVPVPDQSFSESFDDFQEAYNKGWRAINRSNPLGRKWYDVTETPIITSPNYVAIYYPEWNQAQFTLDSLQFGLNTPFPKRYWEVAYSSQRASNGYVATSRASAELINLTGPSTRYNINNWLVSPEVILQNGDKISFYTFCRGVARLQLWINPTNTLEVGSLPSDIGDFTIKLLDINPLYATSASGSGSVNAFPQYWTRFEGTITGLSSAVKGRFGFRYLVEDALPSSTTTVDGLYNELHKSVIGIDAVTYTSQPK